MASSDPTVPGAELFYGLSVGRWPANVGHAVGRTSNIWSVTWYDRESDASFEIDLKAEPAAPFGMGIVETNRTGARALVALAGQLVPLR